MRKSFLNHPGTGGRDAARTRRQDACATVVAHASSVRVRGASLLPVVIAIVWLPISFRSQAVDTNATTPEPRVFLLDAKCLAESRERLRRHDDILMPALRALQREADGALDDRLLSVVD